jgi:hypothetical protein
MERLLIEFPDKAFKELDYNSFKILFSSETDAVRKAGVLKAIKALTLRRTKELLSNYMSEGQRYYNVIFWLDFGVNVPRDRVLLATSRALARIRR